MLQEIKKIQQEIDILNDKILNLVDDMYLNGDGNGSEKSIEYNNLLGQKINLKNKIKALEDDYNLSLAVRYKDVILFLEENNISNNNAINILKSVMNFIQKYKDNMKHKKIKIDSIIKHMKIDFRE